MKLWDFLLGEISEQTDVLHASEKPQRRCTVETFLKVAFTMMPYETSVNSEKMNLSARFVIR